MQNSIYSSMNKAIKSIHQDHQSIVHCEMDIKEKENVSQTDDVRNQAVDRKMLSKIGFLRALKIEKKL